MTLYSEHGEEGDYELMELGDERDFELGYMAHELNRQVESPRSICVDIVHPCKGGKILHCTEFACSITRLTWGRDFHCIHNSM